MSGSKTPTIIAITALLVAALGATPLGQAAGRLVLPKNSVGVIQLKKSAVTGQKVKDGTLLAADFKAGQLPAGPQGPKGDSGTQGTKGDKGDAGAPGPAGISGFEVVTADAQVGAGLQGGALAVCPAGKKAIGGGFWIKHGYLTLKRSLQALCYAWQVTVDNTGVGAGLVTAYAYCAFVS